MKCREKRLLSLVLCLVLTAALLLSASPAYAAVDIRPFVPGTIRIADNAFGTLQSDMICKELVVKDSSILLIPPGVTLEMRGEFYLEGTIMVEGSLTGFAKGSWTGYFDVYLDKGAMFDMQGLSCYYSDDHLRYYGCNAATDGNGSVRVMNGDKEVFSGMAGYRDTVYTYTAEPNPGYRFKNWTAGPGGRVLGTDPIIQLTCEENGWYQVYANFEPDTPPGEAPKETFTVSFHPNGGSGYMDPVTVPEGSVFFLPECGFDPPPGQEFDCWYLGTARFDPGFAIVVDSDAEFVALWKDVQVGAGGDSLYDGGEDSGGWGGGYVAPQRAWKVSLAPMENGKAALGLLSGESSRTELNLYPGTSVYVFPEPDPGYELDKIVWSTIDGSASYDITEAKNFVMPAADAVVHVTFKSAG